MWGRLFGALCIGDIFPSSPSTGTCTLSASWFDSGYMFLRQFGGFLEIPSFSSRRLASDPRSILRCLWILVLLGDDFRKLWVHSLRLWIRAFASVYGAFTEFHTFSTFVDSDSVFFVPIDSGSHLLGSYSAGALTTSFGKTLGHGVLAGGHDICV